MRRMWRGAQSDGGDGACAARELSTLWRRACAVLRSANSRGVLSASAACAALTCLVALGWALHVARAVLSPAASGLGFVLLAVLAVMATFHLWLRMLPPSSGTASVIAQYFSTAAKDGSRSALSEASLLLADSYLLLPKAMSRPGSPFQQPDRSAKLPGSSLPSSVPVPCAFVFPKSLATESDVAKANQSPREYFVAHATYHSDGDAFSFYAHSTDYDLYNFLENVREISVSYPETGNACDIPSKSIFHPTSEISITLSDFCLPVYRPSKLMKSEDPSEVKINPSDKSSHSDQRIDGMESSDVSRCEMCFPAAEKYPWRQYSADGATPNICAAVGNSCRCGLSNFSPRAAPESWTTLLAPKLCRSSRGTNLEETMKLSDY